MTLHISIEVDPEVISEFFKQISDAKVTRALKNLGGYYMLLQRQNIANGIQPDGTPLKQYSQKYLINRIRAGRTSYGFLRLTGDMLKSQRVKVTRTTDSIDLEVEFAGSRLGDVFKKKSKTKKRKEAGTNAPLVVSRSGDEIKNEDLAAWNDETRPFVGVSDNTAEELLEKFFEELGLDID